MKFLASLLLALLSPSARTQDARALAARGQEFVQKGQWEAAADSLRAAVAKDPVRGEYQVLLGVAELGRGRADLAAAALERGAELLPDLADAHYNLGIARYRLERFAEARESFARALERSPDNPDVRFNLALAEVACVELEVARRHLEELLLAVPDHAAAHALLGRIVLESKDAPGRREEARRHLERALALDQKQVEARMQLGLLEREEGHDEAAAQCFRAVLNFRPDHGAALYQLGQLLYRSGDRETGRTLLERFRELEASTREVERLERLIRLSPGNLELHDQLADALLERGRVREARQEYEQVLRADPANLRAELGLARIQWRAGEEAKALERLRALAARAPKSAEVLEEAGLAFQKAGHMDEARRLLEAALAVEPGRPRAKAALEALR